MADPTAREPIEAMVDEYGLAWNAMRSVPPMEVAPAKAALLAAIEALRRDAERFRWIDANSVGIGTEDVEISWRFRTEDTSVDLGRCIDAAISREAPHG